LNPWPDRKLTPGVSLTEVISNHINGKSIMNKAYQALVPFGLMVFLMWPMVSMAGDDKVMALADKSRDSLPIDNALKTQGHVRILVQFTAPKAALSPASNVRALYLNSLRSIQNQFLTRHFGSPEQARLDREFKRGLTLFDISPMIAVTVNEHELTALLSDPVVTAISLDAWDKPHLMDSVPLIGMTGSQGGAYAMGATGEGQAIAILDTGVQADHPFLAGKVIAEACFSNAGGNGGGTTLCPNGKNRQYGAGAADPTIPRCYVDFQNICDHGTHVAGIAAGEKPSIGEPPNGVAVKSRLMAVQVFTRIGDDVGAYVSDLILALEWVYANLDTLPGGNKLAAVNMSLGSGQYTDFCDTDPLLPIINQLKFVGVATVISSGNDSFNFAVSAPACISSAIAVGATTKGDVVTDYSNQSEALVDLLAPGGQGDPPQGIASSIPVSTYWYKIGTSMAAPHVAGAFAAIRTVRPEASVDEIEWALKNSGITILSRGGLFYKPRIQVNAALNEFTRPRQPQTITFGPPPKLTYGGTGIVTATASSGLPVAFATKTPATCSVNVDVVTGIGAGICTIIASQAGNVTYRPAQATQSFEVASVARAAQAITFQPVSSLALGETAVLTASASSGLPVKFKSGTVSVCTVDAGTVTGVGFGVCTVTASQEGNDSYLPAPEVSQSFSVEKISQKVTFNLPDNLTLGSTIPLTATASTGLPVNFRTNTPEVCRVDGSLVTAVGFGVCSITANQIGDDQYASTAITRTLLVEQPNYPAPGIGLNVILTGNAQGSVASDPVGILCGSWCNWSFTKGTRVRLTAIPKDGFRFAGWTGACSGKKTSCTVKLGKAKTVKARFK